METYKSTFLSKNLKKFLERMFDLDSQLLDDIKEAEFDANYRSQRNPPNKEIIKEELIREKERLFSEYNLKINKLKIIFNLSENEIKHIAFLKINKEQYEFVRKQIFQEPILLAYVKGQIDTVSIYDIMAIEKIQIN